jgi:pilus assembly protein CpaF
MFGRRVDSGGKRDLPPPPNRTTQGPAGGLRTNARPAPAAAEARGPTPADVREDDGDTVTLDAAPPQPSPPPPAQPQKAAPPPPAAPPVIVDEAGLERQRARESRLEDIKVSVFNSLIEAIDLGQLSTLSPDAVREEISDVINEIISMQDVLVNAQEQKQIIADICNDILGLGPLEPLLARDDIADIMVNGYEKVYIEANGKMELTNIKFRDNAQLMNVCQRIVSAVGRRVDEASPICDARLSDGSRVNVIVSPLALDGPTLTIRKFKKDKLTFKELVQYGSISPEGAKILEVASASRCNILISGGTGSGKTTLLNCLTNYIDTRERVITCEDAAELQLKNPHVVRLETRPPNLEGIGEITMRDLVRNCLRMRPERIIVGEVRGPEAFDLLQAMNTGHDGSMGTVHANNPREAISRLENMIAMGGFTLPPKATREQISAAITLIVQASRLRDGSRKITQITEVVGMEGDVVTLQDLLVFDYLDETPEGKIIGRHRATGIRPGFWDKVRYFGLEDELAQALEKAGD